MRFLSISRKFRCYGSGRRPRALPVKKLRTAALHAPPQSHDVLSGGLARHGGYRDDDTGILRTLADRDTRRARRQEQLSRSTTGTAVESGAALMKIGEVSYTTVYDKEKKKIVSASSGIQRTPARTTRKKTKSRATAVKQLSDCLRLWRQRAVTRKVNHATCTRSGQPTSRWRRSNRGMIPP